MTNELQETKKVDANDASNDNLKVPSWINAQLFEEFLRSNVHEYKQIRNFKVKSALAPGENYTTIMLRVEIEAELRDNDKTQNVSLMLKIPHDNEEYKEMMKTNNIFDIECDVFTKIIPEFEQLYSAAGAKVRFGAKSYKLETEQDYVLLEDLRPYGFKNADRLAGLDLEHTKSVLKKLAQWHAASATRMQTIGEYPEKYTLGFFIEEHKPMMKQINESLAKPFMQCVRKYQGHETYLQALEELQGKFTDEIFKLAKPDPNDFNVLSHGDCWTNNIMFQYDAVGKVEETYFVDYQTTKIGSPAFDLTYFILSSVNYDLKLQQFDYFIKYYHDNLIESLKLLKYPKKLPTLKEIHMALYKYGLWGFSTLSCVMGAALLDTNENANLENFIGENAGSDNFRILMFSNARYRKHAEAILPWLQNRGALE